MGNRSVGTGELREALDPAGAAPASNGVAPVRPVVRASGAGVSRARRHRRHLSRMALIVLSVAILYVLWVLGSHNWPDYILPHPSKVWDSFTSTVDRGVWTEMIWATLKHMFIAFALILGIGLPLGVVIGRLWFIEDLMRIPLIFLQCVPTVVLIALALIFLGTTDTSVVAVTVASGLTYFTLNVIQGTKSIDHDLVEMGRVYGANEGRLMRTIIIPSVIPYFLAGGRVTLGVVWQVTLFAEYLMGTDGVGFQINSSIKLLDTATVFSWGLSIVALTIAFEYGVFRPIEAFLTRHTRRG